MEVGVLRRDPHGRALAHADVLEREPQASNAGEEGEGGGGGRVAFARAPSREVRRGGGGGGVTGGVEVEARVALAAARVLGEDQPRGDAGAPRVVRSRGEERGGAAGRARREIAIEIRRRAPVRLPGSRGVQSRVERDGGDVEHDLVAVPGEARGRIGGGARRGPPHAVAREEELARGRGGAIERGAGRPQRRRGGRLAQRARRHRGDPSGDGVRRDPGGRRAAHRGRAGGEPLRRRECDARGGGGNGRRDPTSSTACQRRVAARV